MGDFWTIHLFTMAKPEDMSMTSKIRNTFVARKTIIEKTVFTNKYLSDIHHSFVYFEALTAARQTATTVFSEEKLRLRGARRQRNLKLL